MAAGQITPSPHIPPAQGSYKHTVQARAHTYGARTHTPVRPIAFVVTSIAQLKPSQWRRSYFGCSLYYVDVLFINIYIYTLLPKQNDNDRKQLTTKTRRRAHRIRVGVNRQETNGGDVVGKLFFLKKNS